MNQGQLIPVLLTQTQFPNTWDILHEGIMKEVAPGFVAGLWMKKIPNQVFLGACGHRRIFPSRLPMTADTIFDLASVTKVFATATLAAALIDRGWLNWNDPVKAFFPEYSYSDVAVHHLLSHSAGYKAWEPYWQKLRQQFAPLTLEKIPVSLRQQAMKKLILSEKLEVEPGIRSLYSDISFILLGFILEVVTQMPLDHATRHFLWDPMGIQGAYFQRIQTRSISSSDPELDLSMNEKVAATEDSAWRGGILQGQVHDDNCWAMGGYAGHAGAFGTAQNLLHFSRALVNGFLTRSVLAKMWEKVTIPGSTRTLGWDTVSEAGSSAGQFFSMHSVGHLGFTGTSLWIDLDKELAVTLLSNRVHPHRDNWKIKEFRPKFHDAIRIDLRV